jgi:hypothetical protein
MGILDDAIREHLELKRQHGAAEAELKELEDEAFGPPERPGGAEAFPDPFAEAPTEFMAAPGTGEAPEGQAPALAEQDPSRREAPSIADLQEAPEPAEPAAPAEEEQPAMEHEVVSPPPEAPPPSSGPTTEEREAIAEQPTELYDVEGEIAASEPVAPSEEELAEEEISEPRLAPVDPLAGLEQIAEEVRAEPVEAESEEEDDFFDEQRLSDELDQALESPAEELEELEGDDGEDLEDEEEVEEDDEPRPVSHRDDEDLLEDTPDFLEDAPEDDQLWFEQKPPKDFDFDD